MHQHCSGEGADLEYLIIDSTVVRAGSRQEKKGGQAAQALGRSRGGFSAKIHVSVDGLGNPLRFILPEARATARHHPAEGLIAGYAEPRTGTDDAGVSPTHPGTGLDLGMMPVIPPRSNRKEPADYDRHLYRERHLVECRVHQQDGKPIAGSSPGLSS